MEGRRGGKSELKARQRTRVLVNKWLRLRISEMHQVTSDAGYAAARNANNPFLLYNRL